MSLSLYILKPLSVLTALMLYSVLQACYTGYERIYLFSPPLSLWDLYGFYLVSLQRHNPEVTKTISFISWGFLSCPFCACLATLEITKASVSVHLCIFVPVYVCVIRHISQTWVCALGRFSHLFLFYFILLVCVGRHCAYLCTQNWFYSLLSCCKTILLSFFQISPIHEWLVL